MKLIREIESRIDKRGYKIKWGLFWCDGCLQEVEKSLNDGNYEPSNCNFVTTKENNRNRKCVKINMDKANEIRRLYSIGKYTQKELGKKFGLGQQMICFIVNNKNWV